MALNPVTDVFIRERREKFVYRDIEDTDRKKKMEAEIGVVGPQVKRCLGPLELGQERYLFPRALDRSWPY